LFQQAIVQSGAYTLTLPTVAQSEPQGTAYATAVGCTNQDAACLRGLSVSALLAKQSTAATAYLPRVDGSTLPLSIGAAFASGNFNRVNVLEGSTHDEFTIFIASLFTFQGITVTPDNYATLVGALLQLPPPVAQQVVPLVVAQYPLANYAKPELALAAIGTDSVFACNARASAQLLSQYVPLWWYEFDDPDAPQVFLPPAGYPYGAYHGSELKYLFDIREPIPGTLTGPQQQLSDAMVLHWSNFVRLGNPNTLQTSVWPRYQPPLTDRVQLLAPPAPQAYTQTAFATDHKCAFWTQLAGGGS
jgi:para-nitrobenzyl esterase